MPNSSISVTDAQAAAILNHFGTQAAWKTWVAEQTRATIREARVRAAWNEAEQAYEAKIAAIDAER